MVVDCACGIGYGSEILLQNPDVLKYIGVDPSEAAIHEAGKRSAQDNVVFRLGSLESLPDEVRGADTFVMLETLEHTTDPDAALKSVASVLGRNSILIGTVPSKAYEELCEKAYSPNPYHLQRFAQEELTGLLSKHFPAHELMAAEFRVGTLLRRIADESLGPGEVISMPPDQRGRIAGSILFIAGHQHMVKTALAKLGSACQFYPSISKAEMDLQEIKPVREAFADVEERVRHRDIVIKAQAQLVDDRDHLIRSHDAAIAARDAAIREQTAMIDDRVEAMRRLEEMIVARDEAVAAQSRMLEEREGVMLRLEEMIAARDDAVAAQGRMLEERAGVMQRLEEMIAARDEAVAAQSRMLEERAGVMGRLEEMVAARDEAVAAQASLIDDRDDLIKTLEASISERVALIHAQMAMIDERDRMYKDLEATVKKRDGLLESQGRELEEKAAAMRQLRTAITTGEQGLQEVTSRLTESDSNREELARELAKLESNALVRLLRFLRVMPS